MKIIRGFMENVTVFKEEPLFDTHQIVGYRESNVLKVTQCPCTSYKISPHYQIPFSTTKSWRRCFGFITTLLIIRSNIIIKKQVSSWEGWGTPLFPTFGRRSQEDQEFSVIRMSPMLVGLCEILSQNINNRQNLKEMLRLRSSMIVPNTNPTRNERNLKIVKCHHHVLFQFICIIFSNIC